MSLWHGSLGRVQERLTLANVSLKCMGFRLTFANVLLIERSPGEHYGVCTKGGH